MTSLVHAGKYMDNGRESTLLLRKLAPNQFQWLQLGNDGESPISKEFDSLDQALEFPWKEWKEKSFKFIGCGYKFTLPERDEHGSPALFEDMAKSLSSMTGVFFDESLGHNCIVHQIPLNTRRLYYSLKSGGGL